MPEFQLDTTGFVDMAHKGEFWKPPVSPEPWPRSTCEWGHLDAFTQGYIEALFFTECEQGSVREAEDDFSRVWYPATDSSLPGDVGYCDLAPETLAKIIADCEAFQRDNAGSLKAAYARDYDEAQAGRDFWFTRNGHGVGYFDREALEPESEEYESLTRAMVEAGADSVVWGAALAARDVLKAESLGQKLTTAAEACGEVWAAFGDDGKVHL